MSRPANLIRPAGPGDADRIAGIYGHYIAETVITFEEEPVGAAEMRTRITRHDRRLPWLVIEIDNDLVGYAYASAWHTRSAYRKSVEAGIYLDPGRVGQGYGTAIFGALLETLRTADIHCVFGQIALPNEASIALVEKFGFEQIGLLREVGWKFERWVDVGIWQLTF